MKLDRPEVRVLASTVEKAVLGSVDLVARKYQSLHRVASEATFVCPAVVGVDRTKNVVILERVQGIVSVRDAYRLVMKGRKPIDDGVAVFQAAGAALARIHEELKSGVSQEWQPSSAFKDATRRYGCEWPERNLENDVVELHGDFGFANVLMLQDYRGPPIIVIIDPCADGYSTIHDWCSGPRYVDIGKMLLSLEGKVPLRCHLAIDSEKVKVLQIAFIRGYEEIYGKELDLDLCFAAAFALGCLYFEARFSFLGRIAQGAIYNRLWRYNKPLRAKVDGMRR